MKDNPISIEPSKTIDVIKAEVADKRYILHNGKGRYEYDIHIKAVVRETGGEIDVTFANWLTDELIDEMIKYRQIARRKAKKFPEGSEIIFREGKDGRIVTNT